jgi:hypothetical protein
MGEVWGAHNILVGRPEGRRPLGRPRHRWEDNIKMDLREFLFCYMKWEFEHRLREVLRNERQNTKPGY